MNIDNLLVIFRLINNICITNSIQAIVVMHKIHGDS